MTGIFTGYRKPDSDSNLRSSESKPVSLNSRTVLRKKKKKKKKKGKKKRGNKQEVPTNRTALSGKMIYRENQRSILRISAMINVPRVTESRISVHSSGSWKDIPHACDESICKYPWKVRGRKTRGGD